MSKEAMKLALEALWKADTLCPVNSDAEIFVRKAARQIEEALAKQEQGEPVGVVGMTNTVLFKELSIGTHLYTTPQQRKPLTHEQIETLWHEDTSCDMPDELKQFKHTARAIEAAHGIKE